MTAVILAAGMGTRLRPHTNMVPKSLLVVGEKSLLAHSLDNIVRIGIRDIVIVLGYLGALIQRAIGEQYRGAHIRYLTNDTYQETGSMYSFSLTESALDDEPAVLLESDLLYDPSLLHHLLTSPHEDAIMTVPLSGSGDEVYVCADEQSQLTQLGKQIPNEDKARSCGELAGISRFSKRFRTTLFRKAAAEYRDGAHNRHYEESVFAVAQDGHPVYVVRCEPRGWVEVDTEQDLGKAREIVHPQVCTER